MVSKVIKQMHMQKVWKGSEESGGEAVLSCPGRSWAAGTARGSMLRAEAGEQPETVT